MGPNDRRAATVERFRATCEEEPRVVAAFLGGSVAAGTADDVSDLDLYVVSEEADYATFFAEREGFVRSWGEPVFVGETLDFEGFGFDMVHFVLADGVWGELACGHTGNVRSLHGGPHETLVDKTGILEGVSFPLYEPSDDDLRRAVEHALSWFWIEAMPLAKGLRRRQLTFAQLRLGALRDHCSTLIDASEGVAAADRGPLMERLSATFCRSEAAEIGRAAEELVSLHRAVGAAVAASYGLGYPVDLAAVAEAKLRAAIAGVQHP